ncbi:hypothetical protein BMF94_3220 [Rhodotorula taiwanensis]|uniref:F-box domain-containing protein n=1 Tax=Rhodotorula taiwanensis TaxID=741276 RepID=A0A2S5BA88_9BASI|nr:hypothetical protein BMF94_3220 [Rhodotorula taiwanensis]
MTRRNAFRAVILRGAEGVRQFVELFQPKKAFAVKHTMHAAKQIPNSIKSLTIRMGEEGDSLQRVQAEFEHILNAATRVENVSLDIKDSFGFMPLKDNKPWLPVMRTLSLSQLGEVDNASWHAVKLARLRRFPLLRDIRLVYGSVEPISSHRPSERNLQPVQQVKTLYLGGEEYLASRDVARTAALFTSLESVEVDLEALYDEDGDILDYGPLLQAIPPGSLTRLAITTPLEYDWEEDELPPLGLEADFARFVHLEFLSLGAGTFDRSGEVISILMAHLPKLKSLKLREFAYIRAARLLEYVRQKGGSTRALRQLIIDIFDEPDLEGNFIPSESPEEADAWYGTYDLDADWDRVIWPQDFTPAEAIELVDVGAEEGVEILGSIVEAVEVEKLRLRELQYLADRREAVMYDISGLFELVEGVGEVVEKEGMSTPGDGPSQEDS